MAASSRLCLYSLLGMTLSAILYRRRWQEEVQLCSTDFAMQAAIRGPMFKILSTSCRMLTSSVPAGLSLSASLTYGAT